MFFSADLLQFIEQAAAHNLFVILRIGPYVCAEWYNLILKLYIK